MKNYLAKIRIRHNGQSYEAESQIALNDDEAKSLIAAGAIDPNGTPVPELKPAIPPPPIEPPPDPKSVSVTDSEKPPSSKKPKPEA